MSRTFQYNLEHIIPVVQMQLIPNPFEKFCVHLETDFLPESSMEESIIDYDFTFAQEVVIKSSEQLQSVFVSEPCSNGSNLAHSSDELIIPIENLITNNYAPSTLEPQVNGNENLLNFEGFDTQSTDPFQEAELKTINDIEELQTLIFPLAPLHTPYDSENKSKDVSTATPDRPLDSFDQTDTSLLRNEQVPLTPDSTRQIHDEHLVNDRNDKTAEESHLQYVNIDILPSYLDSPEPCSESPSPRPPVPAPRKHKSGALLPPNSPTPQPRVNTPKSTPRAKRVSPETLLAPPMYQLEPTPNPDTLAQSDAYLPVDECVPLPYPQVANQDYTYPPMDPPVSQFPTIPDNFVNFDLTGSILADISRQVNVNSLDFPPLYQEQQEPLTEEEKLYRKIADMGFPTDSVRNISTSFDTKNESQLIEYMLTIHNLTETNGWSYRVVEAAFIFLKGETSKITPYIETFSKYKEMGFEETMIHSALAKCGKEYEKMLEILIESTQ